jgi:pimeloyl-ACP methyl ester carboxylesterase
MSADTGITAAHAAERALWREHGLTVKERYLDIAEPRVRVRMLECGNEQNSWRSVCQTIRPARNLPDFLPSWHSLLRRFLRPFGGNRVMSITADELRRLAHPTLFLWGARDPFGNVDAGRAAAALMKNARLEVVGIGHLPWWDDPETCAGHVRQFLAGETL